METSTWALLCDVTELLKEAKKQLDRVRYFSEITPTQIVEIKAEITRAQNKIAKALEHEK